MSDFSKFARYVIVGLISNLSAFAIYLLITYLGVGHKTAMSLLYVVGAVVSYVGNRNWSFEHKGKVTTSLPRYAIAHLFGYLIDLMLLAVFVDQFGYPHQLVQLCAVVVVAFYLFFMFRYFVFPQPALVRQGGTS